MDILQANLPHKVPIKKKRQKTDYNTCSTFLLKNTAKTKWFLRDNMLKTVRIAVCCTKVCPFLMLLEYFKDTKMLFWFFSWEPKWCYKIRGLWCTGERWYNGFWRWIQGFGQIGGKNGAKNQNRLFYSRYKLKLLKTLLLNTHLFGWFAGSWKSWKLFGPKFL